MSNDARATPSPSKNCRCSTLTEQGLDTIFAVLVNLEHKVNHIMATLADIQAAVAAETEVDSSVEALLVQLSTDLQAAIAANDPVAMQAVVDTMTQNAAALSAAVVANTPAAPAGGATGPTGP
jgi:hexokinase